MFKPFCYQMINNNIRAESKLATAAATFLKWEEVYIFCFFAVRDSWAGRSLLQNASSLPLSRTCSSRGAELTFQGLCFPSQSRGGESICSCSNLLSPPGYPRLHPSLHPRSPHGVSRLFALFVFPCLVPRSLPNSKAFLKCRASLRLAHLSFQTLAGSFAALTCSLAHLWIPAVWMCLKQCMFK